jgi:hypothetical protein
LPVVCILLCPSLLAALTFCMWMSCTSSRRLYWFPSVIGPHRLRVCVGLNCLGEQVAANFHGAEYISYLCGDKRLYVGYVIAQISC